VPGVFQRPLRVLKPEWRMYLSPGMPSTAIGALFTSCCQPLSVLPSPPPNTHKPTPLQVLSLPPACRVQRCMCVLLPWCFSTETSWACTGDHASLSQP
jgi:hypothetical protein